MSRSRRCSRNIELESTMEFTGYDTTIPPRRIELLKSAAAKISSRTLL